MKRQTKNNTEERKQNEKIYYKNPKKLQKMKLKNDFMKKLKYK